MHQKECLKEVIRILKWLLNFLNHRACQPADDLYRKFEGDSRIDSSMKH